MNAYEDRLEDREIVARLRKELESKDSGCSPVERRLPWAQESAGSIPATPTNPWRSRWE